MGERLLRALGAVAAAVAVIAALALLFHLLDDGGDEAARTTVIQAPGTDGEGTGAGKETAARDAGRKRAPGQGGQAPSGRPAGPGHVSVGAQVPRRGGSRGGAGSTAGGSADGPGSASGGGSAGAPAPTFAPPTLLARPRHGTAFEIAHVRKGARVDLRSEPGGPIVARLGDKTEFGSPASFSVVVTKPGWLGVTVPQMPDGELAWIARDPRKVDVYWTRWSIHADLARRSLELRYGKRTVGRFAVTIGGPGTETPPGRYGVTDGLSFPDSPYYGCCALALSGHQASELLAGWIGGDRLAIHGTPGDVGNAESLGCIRATDETMRYLFRRIPLGTPVFIDA